VSTTLTHRLDGNLAIPARLRRARGRASPQPAVLAIAVSPPADEEGLTPGLRSVRADRFDAHVALVTTDLVGAGARTDGCQDLTAATDEAQALARRRLGGDCRPGNAQPGEPGAGGCEEGALAERAQRESGSEAAASTSIQA
jgi:hypothetical protein